MDVPLASHKNPIPGTGYPYHRLSVVSRRSVFPSAGRFKPNSVMQKCPCIFPCLIFCQQVFPYRVINRNISKLYWTTIGIQPGNVDGLSGPKTGTLLTTALKSAIAQRMMMPVSMIPTTRYLIDGDFIQILPS